MKSVDRIKNTGEVFTPSFLVNEILDKLPDDNWTRFKTFLDPACGDGAFLRELKKKLLLKKISETWIIFNQIYGVELMADNAMDSIFHMLTVRNGMERKYKVERFDKTLKPLPAFAELEDKEVMCASVYRFDGNSLIIRKATKNNIRLDPKFLGISKENIKTEIESGVTWFNFKINDNPWLTFPNIVSVDSLKYKFTFGRSEDFILSKSS
jgi:N-6 DNA Methylase